MTGGYFGRSNTRTCKDDNPNTTMCGKKNNALSLVRKKCNNKKRCIVRASNRIYKDLCKEGKSAYLRVNYKCVNACTKQHFQCVSNLRCIPKSKRCDNKRNCRDGSDEANCSGCRANQFQCKTSKKCISKKLVCNKKKNCKDGSDEEGCPIDTKCGVQSIKPLLERPDCPDPFHRIVGGCPVIPSHSWPWTIQLRNGEDGLFFHECAAALLSPSFALTASHCFLFVDDPAKWRAIAGRHNKEGIEPNNQVRNISKIIQFPNPSSNMLDKDLTLVKFDKPFEINTYVSSICLPTREPKVDDFCAVVGWGETRGTGNGTVLKQTLMPIVDRDACNSTDGLVGLITPYMICSGWEEGKNDACQGDSGGPLMCKIDDVYYLQGVVSWGNDCAQPKQPGVYSNVHKALPWITEQIDRKSVV